MLKPVGPMSPWAYQMYYDILLDQFKLFAFENFLPAIHWIATKKKVISFYYSSQLPGLALLRLTIAPKELKEMAHMTNNFKLINIKQT